jgi:Tfp pilus assembly PilM family ATPase
MHVLAIDVGTYSVKFLSSHVERRKVSHAGMSEVVLRDYLSDHPDMTPEAAQVEIIRDIIDSNARPETKVIFQALPSILTTRFLTLPVKQKKKATQMLPFQLEEDIPYALSEIHFAYRLEGQKTQHTALVELARDNNFEGFFDSLRERDSIPNILTSEASVLENFFNQNAMPGPFCVINLGHKTTRAYFFYNSRLLTTHVSYVGGHDVNEMISDTYKIDIDEAVFYKHQNAFVLTEGQYSEVDQAQREFASAMEKVLEPIISDFARWKVGFKVNFGLSVGNVFICGGSANIKNITNYLTEKWDVKVAMLETFDKVEAEKIDLNSKNKNKFALVNMMAFGFRKKNRFINLLSGKYAQASGAELPLHSFAFIGVRVAAISAIFVVSLIVERFFIQRDTQFVNSRLTNITKNEILEINPRLRRAMIQNPKPVLDSLVKRGRGIKQEINTLQSAIEIRALSPLVTLSQVAARTTCTLTNFVSAPGEVKATFNSEDNTELSKLKGLLMSSVFRDVNVTIDEKAHVLNMTSTGL